MNIPRWTFAFRGLVLAVGLLLAGGLLSPSARAVAQSSMDDSPTLVEHLQKKLQSNNSMRRQTALVDLVALAGCPSTCTVSLQSVSKTNKQKRLTFANETGSGAVVDLNALVPDLLEAYRSGPTDGHRLLALAALINIGNEEALEQLIDEGTRQSERTNRATQRSLAAFYLAKYPELQNQAVRNGTLSLYDVRRAEAIQVKRAKKAAKKGAKG